MKTTTKRKLIFLLLLSMILTGLSPVADGAQAAAAETATVRIISTTDLHGQLANTNYDTAGVRSVGSLAQAYTLIKEARKEIKNAATVTVDVGDTIYGYGSDFISSNDGSDFMYVAMSNMGYDAITMGNHDFDYGYKYVEEQLKKTGLADKCVLSNVYDAVTNKTVWNENKMLTKTVTTSKGRKVSVKIGIVGVTRPGLTNYYNHKGILKTQDILESVEEQVKKLKKQGADLIVAIAHSGIGSENPEPMAGDVSYAISKIDGIDAVMCGHSHLNYPSNDPKVRSYYSLPGVNRKTGLMNGKPVIMVADRAAGVGIADLKLQIKNGKISVVSSTADIKYATKNTARDPMVLKYQDEYDSIIEDSFGEEVGELERGRTLTNYFGLLADNTALQLVNESKMQMAMNYINTEGKEYKDYPVIAVSNYKKYGLESKDDYINISGEINMADVLSMQSYYHDYSYVYYITGKQLREWLEWTASAFSQSGSKVKTGDEVVDNYISQMGMTSMLRKDWMDDWSNFWIFDGIEYEFDLSKPPKFSKTGEVISEGTNRVSKLTCNGKPVTDDMKMILASDIITSSKTLVGKEVSKQRIYKGKEFSANLLRDYIKQQSEFGPIDVDADNNWWIKPAASDQYIIRSSSDSEDAAKQEDWYQETLEMRGVYGYYRASYTDKVKSDKNGPFIVLAPTITIKTNKSVPVIVQATDPSGVVSVRFAKGKYSASDLIWTSEASNVLTSNQFAVSENGVYTVWAIDQSGNKSVKYVNISNINSEVLQVPVVNRVTNKSSSVSGKGEPNATITIETAEEEFTVKVAVDGTFTCEIPYPNADDILKISQKNEEGMKSDVVEVKVMRGAPNFPDVNGLTNKQARITADLRDVNSYIIAFVDDKVYVPEDGGKKLYMNSSRYDETLEIVETGYSRDGDIASLTIPVLHAGTKVKVYPIDHISRINYPTNLTVKEVGPEMPVLYPVCDGERFIYGYVPMSKSPSYQITAMAGNNQYTGETDPQGYFKIQVGNLSAGDTVEVTASDVVEEKTRTSASGGRKVVSYEEFQDTSGNPSAIIQPLTDKDLTVAGFVRDFTGTATVKVAGQYYDVSFAEKNSFEIPLEKPLKDGDVISIVLRKNLETIKEAAGTVVTMALPDKPVLLNKAIYTTTKTVKIESADKCSANVKVGSKVYTATKGTYDAVRGIYLYEVKIDKSKAGKDVYVYMEYKTGKSPRIKLSVEEKETEKEKKEKKEKKDGGEEEKTA